MQHKWTIYTCRVDYHCKHAIALKNLIVLRNQSKQESKSSKTSIKPVDKKQGRKSVLGSNCTDK